MTKAESKFIELCGDKRVQEMLSKQYDKTPKNKRKSLEMHGFMIIPDLEQIGELIKAEGFKYESGYNYDYFVSIWKEDKDGQYYGDDFQLSNEPDELTARMKALVKILDMKEE